MITVFDRDIIVASKNGKLLVLDAALSQYALTITKQYNTINEPRSVFANEDFIAVGSYWGGKIIFYQRYGSEEPTVRIKLR